MVLQIENANSSVRSSTLVLLSSNVKVNYEYLMNSKFMNF